MLLLTLKALLVPLSVFLCTPAAKRSIEEFVPFTYIDITSEGHLFVVSIDSRNNCSNMSCALMLTGDT